MRHALAALACALIASVPASTQASDCDFLDAGTGIVRTVVDGRSVVLNDGREVLLAGIEVPEQSKAAVEKLLGSREIAFKRIRSETDRYGRLPAHLFVDGEWVQRALLAGGHARVATRVGDPRCAAQLLRAESEARAAKIVLWSDSSYAPKPSNNLAALLGERGRFTLVEGRVASVRESGGTIYLNFGRRWSEDFTVTVLRRHEKLFTAAGLELKKLAGRQVRVRGVVEERGGPWIEVTRPEQIEIAGQP